MKPLVIYHANCTDGFGAAFAAWLKLGDGAKYLPMNYGQEFDPLIRVRDREIYILDFSFPKQIMDLLFEGAARVVWLDHHKTAFEMWLGSMPQHGQYVIGTGHTIWLDNNKSGAMLAWEYFHPRTEVPMLIQHIDDRDRWVFALPGSKEIHAALNSYKPWSFEQWHKYMLEPYEVDFDIKEGAAILRAHNQNVQAALKQGRNCILDISIDGYRTYPVGHAANAPAFLASDLGHELANKSGTFGLVWSMAADGQVHCSLRSNGEYDVSAIAKAFGGGGHRNAAGFSTDIDTLMGWLK